MEKLYSPQDIEKLFGVTVGRIRYWDKIGFLTPSVKIGGRKYYTSQDLVGLRTAKGLLDAGLSFAKVRRTVIDIKQFSSTLRNPPAQLLIHADEKGVIFNSRTVLSKSSGQLLIGFLQRDFERGMKSANIEFDQDFKPELKGGETTRGNHSRKSGSTKPKTPRSPVRGTKGRTKVKIRGIYTTGLTKFLLDSRYSIVHPSPEVLSRFEIKDSGSPTIDVSIRDRSDRQGVIIEGSPDRSAEVMEVLRNALFDVISRRVSPPEDKDTAIYDVEFPFLSKASLDGMRGEIVPTMEGHHRFRIIASEYVDLVEREAEKYPFKMGKMEEAVKKRVILDALERGKGLKIEHVKPEGKVIQLQGGEITFLSDDKKEMLIRRALTGGRYDGLGLAIEKGDYAITRVREGDWLVKHSYYSVKGRLKGHYWNINTPVEFYPEKIRYVDLHVDVVMKGGGKPEVIDRELLERLVEKEYIKGDLALKAIEVAETLMLPPHPQA
jgi:DNA-binding transcriptional MerR regulator